MQNHTDPFQPPLRSRENADSKVDRISSRDHCVREGAPRRIGEQENTMIRFETAAALCLAVAVASCATGYGPRGLTGGYADEKIDETHYRVKFDGNGHASSDRVWSFWIYRCAELTKEKGYTHFTLLRPGEPLSERRQAPPMMNAGYRLDTSANLINTKGGGYVYVPSYSYGGARITTWHTDSVVSMHRDPLPDYVVVLTAQVVLDQLAPYVKSNGNAPLVQRSELFQRAAAMNRPASNYNFGGEL